MAGASPLRGDTIVGGKSLSGALFFQPNAVAQPILVRRRLFAVFDALAKLLERDFAECADRRQWQESDGDSRRGERRARAFPAVFEIEADQFTQRFLIAWMVPNGKKVGDVGTIGTLLVDFKSVDLLVQIEGGLARRSI